MASNSSRVMWQPLNNSLLHFDPQLLIKFSKRYGSMEFLSAGAVRWFLRVLYRHSANLNQNHLKSQESWLIYNSLAILKSYSATLSLFWMWVYWIFFRKISGILHFKWWGFFPDFEFFYVNCRILKFVIFPLRGNFFFSSPNPLIGC